MRSKIFLTFDVEEWCLSENWNVRSKYNRCTEFSREGCVNLIHLLKKYDIESTFFITGYFAEKEPKIVEFMAKAGQEIASHAYRNVKLARYSKNEIESEITRSTTILSNIISRDITGFRAPQCYITSDIIDILEKLGYRYDSSVHPAIVPGRYYNWRHRLNPYFPDQNNILHKGCKRVLEIPISVVPGLRFPISWWWMRNLGTWVTHFGTKINLLQKRDVILYFHSWEYVELPQIKGMPYHITKNCGTKFLTQLEKFINIFIKKYAFEPLKNLLKKCENEC